MPRRFALPAAVGATTVLALALPLYAAPPGTNHNHSDISTVTCDGGDLTIRAPEKLWPPNHKYYTDIHALADDADDGNVTLETSGTHDQYDGDTAGSETNGAGNTTGDDITTDDDTASVTSDPDDAQVVAAESGTDIVRTDWKARAERSGRIKEGRVYTLTATATWSDGSSCTHSEDFSVPHDMRPSNR